MHARTQRSVALYGAQQGDKSPRPAPRLFLRFRKCIVARQQYPSVHACHHVVQCVHVWSREGQVEKQISTPFPILRLKISTRAVPKGSARRDIPSFLPTALLFLFRRCAATRSSRLRCQVQDHARDNSRCFPILLTGTHSSTRSLAFLSPPSSSGANCTANDILEYAFLCDFWSTSCRKMFLKRMACEWLRPIYHAASLRTC